MKRMKLLLASMMFVAIVALYVGCETVPSKPNEDVLQTETKEEPLSSETAVDVDSVLLWEGSKELDWTPLVIAGGKFADFEVGTVVTLEFTLGSQDWWNFTVMSPDWTELSVPGSNPASDNYIDLIPGQTTFIFTLTDEILKKAKANGLSFAGNPGITVTRIYAN